MATVSGVDLDAKAVLTEEGGRFPYDYLILAAGATTATFGIPGVEEHSFPLKTMPDALQLRAHLLRQFELADNDPAMIDQGALTVVVVGGGPTGVEMAGAIHELFKHVLVHDFPDLDITRSRVVLLEATDHLLQPFHLELAPARPRHPAQARRGGPARRGHGPRHPGRGRAQGRHRDPNPHADLGGGGAGHPLADVLGLEQTRGAGSWSATTSASPAGRRCSSSATSPGPVTAREGCCPRSPSRPSRRPSSPPRTSSGPSRASPGPGSPTRTRGSWPPSAATRP